MLLRLKAAAEAEAAIKAAADAKRRLLLRLLRPEAPAEEAEAAEEEAPAEA